MKSISKVSKENKGKTFLTVLSAIVFVIILFLDQNEIFNIVSTEVVKWLSLAVSMISGIVSYIKTPKNGKIKR